MTSGKKMIKDPYVNTYYNLVIDPIEFGVNKIISSRSLIITKRGDLLTPPVKQSKAINDC